MTATMRTRRVANCDAAYDDIYYGDFGVDSAATQPGRGQQSLAAPELKVPWPRTLEDIPYGRELRAAGVYFPRRGHHMLPPWYAGHPRLPAGFEQPWDAEKEDVTRVKILRRLGTPQALALAAKIEAPEGMLPSATLASACYFRWMRLRFIAGTMANARLTGCDRLHAFSLVAPAFFVPWAEFGRLSHSAANLKNRFRKQLNDAGMSMSGGFVIGGLHADFERDQADAHTGFQFHYHVICDDAMTAVIDRVTATKSYQDTIWVPRPRHHQEVSDRATVASALTYLVKSYWANRSRRNSLEHPSCVRNGSRLAPEQLLQCLSWFDEQRFSDLVFTYDCTLPPFAKKEGW